MPWALPALTETGGDARGKIVPGRVHAQSTPSQRGGRVT